MSWPKAFPNPDHILGRPLTPADPQWRSVNGKPGIYIHDDAPGVDVEIILHQCVDCGHERQTMFSLSASHGKATAEDRLAHSTCPDCLKPLAAITLAQSNLGKDPHRPRPR
jgi:hypothetical protein